MTNEIDTFEGFLNASSINMKREIRYNTTLQALKESSSTNAVKPDHMAYCIDGEVSVYISFHEDVQPVIKIEDYTERTEAVLCLAAKALNDFRVYRA